MFEDTQNGDYDYNDLIIHVKNTASNHAYQHPSETWQTIEIQPIALGSTKTIKLGCILSDGSTHMISEKEEGLIQMVADFAAVVRQAGEDYSPSGIANYVYDLVKEYNQFYHDFSILREENEDVKLFRIALSANIAKVVRLGMGLLGIEVPDRM